MSASDLTPCAAMFGVLKRQGGISYKELAGLILSGKPLSDGRSPVSRVNDRTWVSRFIVHAPLGSLQERYFCDFGIGALRVVSRLKSKEGRGMTSRQVLDLVCGRDGLPLQDALSAHRQDVTLYRNVLDRLGDGSRFSVDERAEVAMVLFVAAGCTADVRRAVKYALDFSQSVQGGRLATPLTASPLAAVLAEEKAIRCGGRAHLQLLRVVDGCVSGLPHWVAPSEEGAEVGALALSEGAVTDVGPGVSAHHARIWCDAEGRWFVEGLGSRNGTVVRSGATRECTVVEPPRDRSEGFEARPVRLRSGDELLLADDTAFIVLEGFPAV